MSLTSASDLVQRLRAPAYMVLGVALFFQVFDLILTVYPMHLGVAQWRFGAAGQLAVSATSPLLILLLLYAVALLAGDRAVVGFVGVFSALAALVLILGTVPFMLDTLEMRSRLQGQATGRFLAVSGQALAKLFLHGLAAAALAISALRTLRGIKARRSTERAPRSDGLVVGSPAKPGGGE